MPVPSPGEWPVAGARFAADDDPADARQGRGRQGAKQWLAGQEPDGGRHCAQVIDADRVLAVFHGDAHPQVRRPVQLAGDLAQPGRALGQNLEGVLRRVRDHGEDLADEAQRHPGVEQVVPAGSERCRALSHWGPLQAVSDTFWRGVGH